MTLRSSLSTGLRLTVAVVLIGFIVRELGGGRALLEGLAGLGPAAITAALVANLADRLLMTWKWILLLRARGHTLPLLQGTRIYCASMVWGIFLPATMGSDAVRAVSTARAGVPGSEVVASIVIERALGLLASLIVALLGLLAVSWLGELPPVLASIWWMGGLALLAGAALLLASLSDWAFTSLQDRLLGRLRGNPLVARLRDLHESYRAFRDHPGALWRFFLLSLLEQLGPFVPIWFLAVELGVGVNPIYLAGAVSLSFLVARAPISLGGIGVMEGTLVFLLTLVGLSTREAATIAVAGRIVEISSWLPWWVSFVASRGSLRRPQAA